MILNTGSRTDIPAFYSEWFMRRIESGSVCVRHPFQPKRVLRYQLDPSNVDVLVFCTKNPKPMLEHLDRLMKFNMFWGVTITPYDQAIEPLVPPVRTVVESFKLLSSKLGKKAVECDMIQFLLMISIPWMFISRVFNGWQLNYQAIQMRVL